MRNNILLVEEQKGWVAFNLEYSNFVSQGDTLFEAKENMKEVLADIILHNELVNEQKKDLPTNFKEYLKSIYKDQFKNIKQYILSEIDVSKFLNIKDAHKSERTNVSIKRGYKVLAKLKKLNISEFINKCLSKELDTKF